MVNGFRPGTFEEALSIKSSKDVLVYAGGTDCMVHRKSEAPMLFIGHLRELKEMWEDGEGITIGAASTYAELLASLIVPEILKRAAAEVASPAIRNVGTIGGNLCNASPAGDTLPVLYALHALVKLTSLHSSRMMKIEDFIKGPKQTVIGPDEILESITLPKQSFNKVYYQKIGARKADAISKLSFVGLMQITDGTVQEMRVAVGAVAPIVVKDRETERMGIGRPIEEVLQHKKEFLDRYKALITPIDDQRSTASYRKKTSLRLIEDFMVTSCLN